MIVTIELKSSVEAEEVAKLQETVLMTFPNQIDKIQKFFMGGFLIFNHLNRLV